MHKKRFIDRLKVLELVQLSIRMRVWLLYVPNFVNSFTVWLDYKSTWFFSWSTNWIFYLVEYILWRNQANSDPATSANADFWLYIQHLRTNRPFSRSICSRSHRVVRSGSQTSCFELQMCEKANLEKRSAKSQFHSTFSIRPNGWVSKKML